ncbi:hypothetical protein EG327_005309 [Venturia inaequalis]|uniref:Major facilitator superfamily (MFS) profile domain-containing protein n=1 Tax=Venturia inaequalis TaxID=5025 RepID=A0A8H3Z5G7_VENIN|nr:hypothetical protein EG327_005309 [Venturia inaequalis]
MGTRHDEHTPLLRDGEEADDREILRLTDDDPENPRSWPRWRKLANVAVVAFMAGKPYESINLLLVFAHTYHSIESPGILHAVIGATTGFVVFLGIGPLILAPLSETFGRRRLYIICFSIFTLLQIPTALSPNIATLIALRTLSGFFGSVGIANGGGTLSDMFEPGERAGVFGWYLLGPLLGPTLGPLFGGIIVQRLNWRWIFWVLTIVCGVNTLAGYFLLRETYSPVLLAWRKQDYESASENSEGTKYRYEGEDPRPLRQKLRQSFKRPLKILVQPIVFTMSVYQALIFGTTYSIYTNMQSIYSGEYGFDTEQVGLMFAWTVEYHTPWPWTIAATFFYGIGQVMILNTVQNYYIDSFEKYAASAIAAGALFRSVFGGVVPLLAPGLFDKLGYGWGISIFGFLSVVLAPAPVLFWVFGERIRGRFCVEL